MIAAVAKSNEERLKILLDWKKSYIQALVNALKPSDSILEIGFGVGLGAESIQSHKPKNYTIIESNPQYLEEAQKLAKKNPNIHVMPGDWKTVLPTLGKFDAIFFNDYPLEDDRDIMRFLFPDDLIQTAGQAKDMLSQLEKEMALIKKQFSDQEIEDFYKKVGQNNMEELPKFFLRLKENGNISKAQYDQVEKRYQLERGKKQKAESPKNQVKETVETKKSDPVLQCLEECLKDHMSKGSRFAFFLNKQVSKYEDSQFFDKIITNPNVDYKETSVTIKMNDKERDGIVMIVEKS